jgi:multiple sugar transport system substrate-binding protein
MRHSRSYLVTAAAAVATSLALAACGGGPAKSASPPATPHIRGQSITYWASVEGTGASQTTRVLSAQFADFTEKTGVKVHLEVIPWSDLLQKILTAVTSGSGPDVMEIGNTWSPSFAASGGFLSFTPSAFSQIGRSTKFSPSALSVSGAPGKAPISVPVYSEAYGLFYNKADFKAAGISHPPTSWKEFLADARKLTTDGRYGVAIEGASTSEAAHWAFLLGEQYGNPIYANGKWDFATTKEAKAVSLYVNLVADGVADKSDAENNSNVAESDFANNKAAMLVWQNPMSTLSQLGMGSSAYGIAPIPVVNPLPSGGKDIETFPAGINLAVPSSTTHRAAALALVKYLTSTPVQTSVNKTYGTFPPVLSAQKAAPFQTADEKTLEDIYNNHATPLPRVPSESTMETDLGGAITHLIGQAATSGAVSVPQIKAALTSGEDQLNAASGS